MIKKIGIITLILLIGLGIGVVLTANFELVPNGSAEDNPAATTSEDLSNEIETLKNTSKVFTSIAKSVTPAIVTITSEKVIKTQQMQPFGDLFGDEFFERFFDMPRDREFKQQALGSGVLVDEDGYILTNNHVVERAEEIEVRLQDERTYEAEIVGTDPRSDLAVIKIDTDEDLPTVPIGNSDEIEVGEWVLAIGSPFHLSSTVTAGIISAKGRANVGITDYEDFIQTDAAINPGNSGGGLVNLEGKLIGINTAIATRSGGNMGIGFAIPINMARNIMDDLIEHGKVTRGWLGVYIQDINDKMAKGLDLETTEGVLVSGIQEDSPAERAGFKRGDIIIAVNDEEVAKMYELRNKIASFDPGSDVEITILRDGKEKTLDVELGELESQTAAVEKPDEETAEKIGISVKNITPSMAQRYDIDQDVEGVVVTDVERGSSAAENGIRPGDVILEIDKNEIESVKDYNEATKDLEDGDVVVLLIQRGDNTIFTAIEIEEE